jgi:hypothetical protein
MTMNKTVSAVIALLLAWTALPARAHHSFAMFDLQKSVVVAGQVKEFQWTNPHSWLQVLVPNKEGGVDEWSIEMGSIRGLHSAGWKPGSVRPGEKVSVTLHPMRDGSHAGSFVSVTLADGRVLATKGEADGGNKTDAAKANSK